MAAGKSTLASDLASRYQAVLFSEDQLLEGLYPGEIVDLPGYVQYALRVKETLKPVFVDLLRNGTSVILDFPANTVEQRRWLHALAVDAGASHELHYLQASDDKCKRQLAKRAAANPARRRTDTPQMFEAVTRHFQPPAEDEGLTVIQHRV